MNVKFGELIRNYRKQKNLTQIEFGDLLNKSQVTISAYEKNKHFPTSANEIDDVARVISQSVNTVVSSIKYAKTGEHDDSRVIVDINSKSSAKELKEMYQFIIDGVEVTDEELKDMIDQVLFSRFREKNKILITTNES